MCIYTHIHTWYNKYAVTVTMKIKKMCRVDQNNPFKEMILGNKLRIRN